MVWDFENKVYIYDFLDSGYNWIPETSHVSHLFKKVIQDEKRNSKADNKVEEVEVHIFKNSF